MKQNFAWILTSLMLSGLLGMPSMSLAEEDTWTKKADMPMAIAFLSTSVVGGKIYAIGGAIGTAGNSVTLSTMEEYDPATDTWTKKADMPTARCGLSTSVIDGKIYAIGGAASPYGAVLSSVQVYDPATDTWMKKADMPTARAYLSTSVVNGKIYTIGGARNLKGPGLSAVEVYDPVTDIWTKKADMPTARHTVSTSVVDGKIYAIGGLVSTGDLTGFSTVEEYDPTTDTWTTKAPMPTARRAFSTSVVDGKIYAIGGAVGRPGRSLPPVEEYDTGFVPLEPTSIDATGKLATTWGGLNATSKILVRTYPKTVG